MKRLMDVLDEDTEAQIKEFLDERLELLYQEQGDSQNEWNDAIDSARRIVHRS